MWSRHGTCVEINVHVHVPGAEMKRAEKHGYRLKKPPTKMMPSAETKPFESRLISSKNSTDVRAAVPSGIASYILVEGFRMRTQLTHIDICIYAYSFIYVYTY